MRDLCNQCKCSCQRDVLGRLNHRSVNCLAYGCDHFNETGSYCYRDDIVAYCLELFNQYLKERKENELVL